MAKLLLKDSKVGPNEKPKDHYKQLTQLTWLPNFNEQPNSWNFPLPQVPTSDSLKGNQETFRNGYYGISNKNKKGHTMYQLDLIMSNLSITYCFSINQIEFGILWENKSAYFYF